MMINIIKKVFVFGNQDIAMDSLPLRILPKLREKFPDIQFEFKDPNEEWDIPDDFIVIDTVVAGSGCPTSRMKEVMVFDDLDKFVGAPTVSMHDFDALANLRLLKKLGKIKKIKVIGVPPELEEKIAIEEVFSILSSITNKSAPDETERLLDL